MPVKLLKTLFLVAGLFYASGVSGQGVTDTLGYRQAKLGIWCQTIKFIYQDNGEDRLAQTLNCQDWEAFKRSLEPNNLQSNTFFQAIEKPAIYAGYTSYDAKLQKLISEIENRLRSSPVRAGDQGRLEKVDSLRQLLLATAANPALAIPLQAEQTEEKQEAPPVLVNEQAPVRESAENTESLEEDEMEITELLQWIMLLLLTGAIAWLWLQNRKLKNDLNVRMLRRKQEIGAVSRVQSSKEPEVLAAPKGLGKEEVVRLIRAEIEKLRQAQKQQRQEKLNSIAEDKDRKRVLQSKEKPAPSSEAPKEEKKGETGLYYDKLPFKGGFHHNQLSDHRNPDSIYSIQVLERKPDEAEFWVTEDQEIQKYAMQNGLSFFEEACEYSQVEENPSRVRNLERGRLRKNGHLWQIEKKVKVIFE